MLSFWMCLWKFLSSLVSCISEYVNVKHFNSRVFSIENETKTSISSVQKEKVVLEAVKKFI